MVPLPPRAGALLARYAFIEPLLPGRRVLEFGAAGATAGESARFLAERGAAEVLSVERDEAALAAAMGADHPASVRFLAAEAGALPAGAFDLVLLADGAPLAADPGRAGALRPLLAQGGRLVTAVDAGGAGLAELAGEPRAAEPPPYGAFVSALSATFPTVEIATQAAHVGWVFGLPADGEPEVTLEGALAGTAETAAYVAICGEAPSGLAGITVVALPTGPLLDGARRAAEAAAGEAARLREEVATRAGENAILSRELERVSEVVRELTDAAAAPPPDGAGDAPDLERRLAEAIRRAAEAEAALEARPPPPLPTGAETGEALRRATEAREALVAQLAERDAKVARLQREVADKTERLGRLAREMSELKARGLGKLFR